MQLQETMAGDGGAKAASSSPEPSSPSKGEQQQQQQVAKEKPVKVLPCPRCESMNTKFCYYNNYSVTQPRHFCRQCQRYWTAGGTLRNVPVGGGSRKKNRHPRSLSEPYLQRSAFGNQPAPLNPGGHFQQMLSQDMMQFPGYGYNPYVALDPEPVMYGTAVAPPPPPPQMHQVPPYFLPQATQEVPAFSDGIVKNEFWPPQGPLPGKRFESSMLLNLGLNSRPKPVWDQSATDLKPTTKNGSPPHGSSTIEEEGSTPTNGYSNNGYEEENAVSSMWQSLQIDTMFP